MKKINKKMIFIILATILVLSLTICITYNVATINQKEEISNIEEENNRTLDILDEKATELENLQKEKEEIENQKEELNTKLSEKDTIEKDLNSQLEEKNKEIESLKQEINKLKQEIAKWNYNSSTLSIKTRKVKKNGNTMYVSNVYIANPERQIKSAFAGGSYSSGVSGKEKTSSIAKRNGAIFAVNGDAYGFKPNRLVIRNGEINNLKVTGDYMAIKKDGTLTNYPKGTTPEEMINDGTMHVYNFGPTLVKDGQITASALKSAAIHPRTSIGQIDKHNFVFIVVDGRQEGYSIGINYKDLADEFISRGCTYAYNLDGGGSSTMYLNGNVLNKPCDYTGERPISDILYLVD